MRAAVVAWGRRRWRDCRVIHELILGDRRIDLAFVRENDIVGVEIKSSRDRLGRLDAQMREFRLWLPEVWIAVAPRWEAAVTAIACGNILTVDRRKIVREPELTSIGKPARAFRDELICSRLIGLLSHEEAERIARRTAVILPSSGSETPDYALRPLLARLLTGNEIMREVCRELRARGSLGHAADAPIEVPAGAFMP